VQWLHYASLQNCNISKCDVLRSLRLLIICQVSIERLIALNSHSVQFSSPSSHEDLSEYVAHLQLHMALQARNLVPRLNPKGDSREQMLQQTQADFEKFISRQVL